MPTIRKLTPDEIPQWTMPVCRPGHPLAQDDDTLLEGFASGDWGVLVFADDDNRLAVRSRLQAAAEDHGLHLVFHRMIRRRMHFTVEAVQVESSVEESAAGKKLGWKPKITV